MKWIPIFGMFTKDADKTTDSDTNLGLVLYHGFILSGLICFLGYILLKI